MDGNTGPPPTQGGHTKPEPVTTNPLSDAQSPLHRPDAGETTEPAHPQQEVLPGDSATTRAEKTERHGSPRPDGDERPPKRVKLEQDNAQIAAEPPPVNPRVKGVAQIKAEYLVQVTNGKTEQVSHDDDAAEQAGKADGDEQSGGKKKKKAKGGQNKARTFGSSRDAIPLCMSRMYSNEFGPKECSFGDKCKYEHDLRKYLREGKRENLTTFNGQCPIYQAWGKCNAGWKCRFAGSHSTERETEDGRKELILLGKAEDGEEQEEAIAGIGVVNDVPMSKKLDLKKKKFKTVKSDAYVSWLDKRNDQTDKKYGSGRTAAEKPADTGVTKEDATDGVDGSKDAVEESRAGYIEPPLKPSEKRKIYYGAETPVLAPLTTQGNLPFRRLAVSLGAQVTWSEMAMGLPLIQGEKSEWALIKAHESEVASPKYTPQSVVAGYDNSKDIKFGAQIAGNKPWLCLKTTEVLTALAPHLRAIDLNCGCPIDLLYRQGAGSALLDSPGKLEKILRGMNAVSNEVPITVKIRMGTKDNYPTADRLVQRFVIGGEEAQDFGDGPAGVAAITLHGRSRQQRYTRSADWEYIADCAAIINRLQKKKDEVTDTVREPDARDLTGSNNGNVYFLGNGDCYSHVDYYNALDNSGVDSVMIGRGALVKPWIFEEIEKKQYLDKSASERLGYIEQFARNGLEYWGSDEVGVGQTRRFLLEWLSFSCRYVPIGLLEHLPPRLGDRPPAYKGRSDLETLLSSANYKDWIKISEMFLGPAHKDFQFQPKHKSNSYEIEAEG